MFTGLRKDEAATLCWANVHLNGKPPNGYIHLTVDDLVQPMQEIPDFMEENMGLKKNSAKRKSKKKVIEMNKRSASS